MSEWIHSTVGAVTAYQRAGGTPTAGTDAFYGGEIPFVTIEDITNGTRFLDRTEKNLSVLGLRNSAAWLIQEPHILYSM
jgi:type I restriction enzyme, S subunit